MSTYVSNVEVYFENGEVVTFNDILKVYHDGNAFKMKQLITEGRFQGATAYLVYNWTNIHHYVSQLVDIVDR